MQCMYRYAKAAARSARVVLGTWLHRVFRGIQEAGPLRLLLEKQQHWSGGAGRGKALKQTQLGLAPAGGALPGSSCSRLHLTMLPGTIPQTFRRVHYEPLRQQPPSGGSCGGKRVVAAAYHRDAIGTSRSATCDSSPSCQRMLHREPMSDGRLRARAIVYTGTPLKGMLRASCARGGFGTSHAQGAGCGAVHGS